ncbi:hypothetical protein BGX34_006838 [Mortierella sp. NVP85]|nr:hypothetical protein BGX34_006838 [Mortierella sp. NVP85]
MAEQSNKEQQQAIKATLKAIDSDYKNKVREAEKKCTNLRKEADKVAEREKAIIKAKKDKADKEAKEELQLVKQEAAEVHIKLVMDLVKNVILDIKSRSLEQSYANGGVGAGAGTLERSNSTVSSSSSPSPPPPPPVSNGSTGTSGVAALFGASAGTSAVSSWFSGGANSSSSSSSASTLSSPASKEYAEIKEWVDYAAERLDIHMSKHQVRQKLMEEVTIGAIVRQHQAQQEAMRRTEELEKQIQQLQLLHQQHLQQGGGRGGDLSQGQEIPPPTYASINMEDYSFLDSKDKKEES